MEIVVCGRNRPSACAVIEVLQSFNVFKIRNEPNLVELYYVDKPSTWPKYVGSISLLHHSLPPNLALEANYVFLSEVCQVCYVNVYLDMVK